MNSPLRDYICRILASCCRYPEEQEKGGFKTKAPVRITEILFYEKNFVNSIGRSSHVDDFCMGFDFFDEYFHVL